MPTARKCASLLLYYEQRHNITSIIYIKQEGVTLATFMDISLEEDTIHCQDFQGLYDCIHSCRKLLWMKNLSQKGGILHHLNQLINLDKTVTQLVEKLAAFQNIQLFICSDIRSDDGGFVF